MEEIKLDVDIRQETGTRKVKNMRQKDFIPAIVYGGKEESVAVKVNKRLYQKISRAHKGRNIIFDLHLKDGDKELKSYPAIVREEQEHPVTEEILHIDFNKISLTEEIHVKVAIVAKGEAVGVKQDGGILDHVMWELEVLCLPKDIPEKIEVDVTNLKMGEFIYLKDITLPQGVKTKQSADTILFTVVHPMKEEVVVAGAEATAPAEPEVLREKKKEEGAEATTPVASDKDKEKEKK